MRGSKFISPNVLRFFISFYGTTCRRRLPSDHTLNSRGPSRKQLKHLQSHHETWNFHSTTIKLILHHTMNYHHHETGTNILSSFCLPPEGQGMLRFFFFFLGLYQNLLFLLIEDFLYNFELALWIRKFKNSTDSKFKNFKIL